MLHTFDKSFFLLFPFLAFIVFCQKLACSDGMNNNLSRRKSLLWRDISIVNNSSEFLFGSCRLTRRSWFSSLLGSDRNEEAFTIPVPGPCLAAVKADLTQALLSVSSIQFFSLHIFVMFFFFALPHLFQKFEQYNIKDSEKSIIKSRYTYLCSRRNSFQC